MNEDQKTKIVNQKLGRDQDSDEIELIDLIRVDWKWKYFILLGTLFCGLIAVIISLKMDKVYSIDMVLRPGILSIGEKGKNIYIDSSQNIKALIKSGMYNSGIFNYLKTTEENIDKAPKRYGFKATILKDSNTIMIEYETSDIKQGMDIQNYLSKLLLEKYSNMVKYYKNEYDMKLSLVKSETDYIKTAIQSYKRNVKNIEKRIDELISEIELIKKNTTNLITERNKLLSKNPKENNILSALLYSNTIQQNLQLYNRYQDENNNYKRQKENELQEIKKSEHKIIKKLNEKKNLQFKSDSIQNIQILNHPQAALIPLNQRKSVMLC